MSGGDPRHERGPPRVAEAVRKRAEQRKTSLSLRLLTLDAHFLAVEQILVDHLELAACG